MPPEEKISSLQPTEAMKLYEILREYVKHEDTMANLRLTWMLTAQPIFVTALAWTFAKDEIPYQFRIRLFITIFAAVYTLLFIPIMWFPGKVLDDLDRRYKQLPSSPLWQYMPNIRWGDQLAPPAASFPGVPILFCAMWSLTTVFIILLRLSAAL